MTPLPGPGGWRRRGRGEEALHEPLRDELGVVHGAHHQGHTLVHFSSQLEPFVVTVRLIPPKVSHKKCLLSAAKWTRVSPYRSWTAAAPA